MELQLSTAKAEASLKRIEAGLDSLRASLDRAGSGSTQFNTLLRQLETMRGINPQAVTSINQLAAALKTLNGGQINQLSASLNKLAGLDVSKAAISVRSLATSLSSIRVPPGLAQVASHMNQIAASATKAATAMRSFGAASTAVKVPTGLAQTATALNNISTSANAASKATAYFGTAAGNLRAGLAALGIAAVGREIGQFVKTAYDAQVAYDKFNAIMNNTTGAGTAAAQFDYLRKVAAETATDLQSMLDVYPKFAMAANAAGFSASQVGTMFQQAATMTRGFGLSTVDAELAMRAITQMMTKGRIQAEELRQQLAERGVPAMAALAQGTGKTTAELEKMMEQGQLTTEYIQIMIEELGKMSAGSVAAQLGTINAQMTALANSFTLAKLSFGDGFFPVVSQGLAQLNSILQSDTSIQFFQTLGMIAGQVANLVLTAVSSIITVLNGMFVVFRQIYDTVLDVWEAFKASPLGTFLTEVLSLVPAVLTFRDALYGIGVILGVAVAALALYGTALLAVAAAKAALLLVTNPLVAGIALAGIATIAAAANFGKLGEESTALRAELQSATTSFGAVEGSADDAAKGLVNVEKSTTATSKNLGTLNISTNTTVRSMDTFGDSLNDVRSSADAATDGLVQVRSRADDASQSFSRTSTTANSAITNIRNSGTAANTAAGFWRRLADAIWEAFKALVDYNKESGNSSGGGTDVPSTSSDTYAEGGIVGRGSRTQQSVPITAFANAPHFASGGTTSGMAGSVAGGGIPAILHPDEAVIPLASGAVPVQLSGGGSDALARIAVRQLQESISLNRYAGGIYEKLIDIHTVIHGEGGRIYSSILDTNNLLSKVVVGINSMGRTTTVGSGGSSGSGSGSGIAEKAGPLDEWTDVQKYQYEMMSGTLANKFFVGGNPLTAVYVGEQDVYESNIGLPGGFNAINSTIFDEDVIAKWKADNPDKKPEYRPRNFGSDPNSNGMDLFKNHPTLANLATSFPGFAKGSPNVFSEASGRSALVSIHPDEAVVPLPDGRRIPVDISGLEVSGRGGSETYQGAETTSTGSGNITVNITVHAKDADSFRASQEQILQQMQQRMRRAVQNLGETTYTDDPTVRPKS